MESIVTISSAASERRLTTVAAFCDLAGLANRSQDTRIDGMIRRASSAIETYLGRVLARETVSEQFRLETGTRSIVLDRWPVVSISSLAEAGEELDAEDYECDADSGTLYRLCDGERTCFSCGTLIAVYTSGYILPRDTGRTLPRDIEEAALMTVRDWYFAAERDPKVRQSDVPGVLSETYWVGGLGDTPAIPPEAVSLLEPYRRIPL